MSRINRVMVILVVLAAMLVSMACSLSSILPDLGGESATATPDLAVNAVPTQVAMPTEAAKPTSAAIPTSPAATLQPGATNEPKVEVQSGLDKLDSYRMNYNMTITGKNSKGADAKQELKLLQETIKSKESLRTFWTGSGISITPGSDSFDLFQIGKTSYMRTPAKDTNPASCISFSSDKPAFDKSQLLAPDELLADLQKGDLVAKGETVNGVKADHYKLLKANLGFGTATSQTGDVWLAQSGGYLVKFEGHAYGEFSLSTEKISGVAVWDYNLTQINQLKEIALPAECTAASSATQDLPVPSNAVEKSTFGEIITFSSPDAPSVVAEFYRKELPVKGWAIKSDQNLGTVVMLSITKDTRKFSIMITPGQNDKGATVMITKVE